MRKILPMLQSIRFLSKQLEQYSCFDFWLLALSRARRAHIEWVRPLRLNRSCRPFDHSASPERVERSGQTATFYDEDSGSKESRFSEFRKKSIMRMAVFTFVVGVILIGSSTILRADDDQNFLSLLTTQLPADSVQVRMPDDVQTNENITRDVWTQLLEKQGKQVMAGILQNMLNGLTDKPLTPLQVSSHASLNSTVPPLGDERALIGVEPDTDKFSIKDAVFAQADRLFIGPDEDGKTVSRVFVMQDDNGVLSAALSPLLPQKGSVTVNGSAVTTSPLKEKKVAHLALAGSGKKLAVVLQGDPDTNGRNGASIYLSPTDDGATLVTHQNVSNPPLGYINDAAGVALNQQILAVTASQPPLLDHALYFAAVADGSPVVADIKYTLPSSDVTDVDTAAKIQVFSEDGATEVDNALDGGSDEEVAAATIKNSVATHAAIGQVVFDTSNTENNNSEAILLDVIEVAVDSSASILIAAQGAGHGKTASQLAGAMSKSRMIDAVHKGLNGDPIATFLEEIIAQSAQGTDLTLSGAAGAIEGAVANALVQTLLDVTSGQDVLVPKDSLRTWASDTVIEGADIATIGDGITSLVGVDGVNRGVAVLKKSGNQLLIVDHDTTPTNPPLNKAAMLRIDAEQSGSESPLTHLSFYDSTETDPITRALIGNNVVLHWDEPLQRLYLGLSDVTRGSDIGLTSSHGGGVCSVAVGSVDSNKKLSLFSVIKDASLALLPANENVDALNHHILGFYRSSDQFDSLFVSAFNLKTMHTSTGKTYLIINGGVSSFSKPNEINTQVYAVPLVSSGTDQGFLGAYNGSGVVSVTQSSQMPVSTQQATIVGSDPYLLSFNTSQEISDMQVVGDTVYASLVGVRDSDHLGEAGIFASTALFDPTTGMIRAWTPWRRVMGRTDSVFRGALDNNSGNYWFVTTVDGNKENSEGSDQVFDTVKITQWGMGDSVLHESSDKSVVAPLSSVIDPAFEESHGLTGLFDFDSGTQGFREQVPQAPVGSERNRHQQFALMVALGLGKLALIETGKYDQTAQVFLPTVLFQADDEEAFPVRIFDATDLNNSGQSLKELGVLVAAEVSRLPLEDENAERGWLFVGGQEGLAVFSNAFDGQGWPTGKLTESLAAFKDDVHEENFPRGFDWDFLKLVVKDAKGNITNPFTDVRKLVSDGNKYLYVVTASTIYRFEMKSQNFLRDSTVLTHAVLTDLTVVASLAGSSMGGMQDMIDEYFDLMVVKRNAQGGTKNVQNNKTVLLIGTSRGMFINTENSLTDKHTSATVSSVVWNKVQTSSNSDLGPAIFFDFTSSMRGFRMIQPNKAQSIFYADGNLKVYAFDTSRMMLGIYRFDIANGQVAPFNEPYRTGSTQTDFFVKIGALKSPIANVDLNGPIDYYPQKTDISESEIGFPEAVPNVPDPALFLNAGKNSSEINLNIPVTVPLNITQFVVDSASGAVYVPGEFGVRVNE